MKLLFIGDMVGRPARNMVKEHLKGYRNRFNIDFVIANSENASAGFGVSTKNAGELLTYGIDCQTGGNHSFDKKGIFEVEDFPIIRPLNYYDDLLGDGYKIFDVNGEKLAVINALGSFTFTNIVPPFRLLDELTNDLNSKGVKHIFVDFHAESTAEKVVVKHLLANKASAVIGTHTHVGTDDLEISNGMCYLTDVGMSGCCDGVIGMSKDAPIARMLNGYSQGFKIEYECKKLLQFVVIELDSDGKCIDAFKIKRYDDTEVITKKF